MVNIIDHSRGNDVGLQAFLFGVVIKTEPPASAENELIEMRAVAYDLLLNERFSLSFKRNFHSSSVLCPSRQLYFYQAQGESCLKGNANRISHHLFRCDLRNTSSGKVRKSPSYPKWGTMTTDSSGLLLPVPRDLTHDQVIKSHLQTEASWRGSRGEMEYSPGWGWRQNPPRSQGQKAAVRSTPSVATLILWPVRGTETFPGLG